MSNSSRFEDLKINEIREKDALIADYNDDYIYTVTSSSCDCDEFQDTHEPCIHILFYQQNCSPSLRARYLFNKRLRRLKYAFIFFVISCALYILVSNIVHNATDSRYDRIVYSNDVHSLADMFVNEAERADFDYKNSKIEGSATNSGVYVISFTANGIYANNADFLTRMYSRYINYCRKAYAVDGVEKITFDISASVRDRRGNFYDAKVMTISMSRDKFELYNWDTMERNKVAYNFALDGHIECYNGVGDALISEIKYNSLY